MPTVDEYMAQRTELQPMYPDMNEALLNDQETPPAPQPETINKYETMPIESMVDQEIVGMVNSRKESSRIARTDKKLMWDKCWDHYLQIYDSSGKESWQSTVFQPETTKVVEIISSNITAALLSPSMPAEWESKVKDADNDVRDANDLIKNDLEKSRFKIAFDEIIRSLCVLGTAVGKVGYNLKKKDVTTRQQGKVGMAERMISMALGRQPEQPEDVYSQETMAVQDWTDVKCVDLYKIYPEPNTTEIGEDFWIIEESEITNKELVELSNHEDPYYRVRNITPDVLNAGVSSTDNDPETQQRRWAMLQRSTSLFFLDPDKKHRLDEMYGPVPVWMIYPELRNDESRKYESINAWVCILDGQTVIRAVPTPFRDGAPPYFKADYVKIPGSWYGLGPAEMIINLQINANELVNTKTDNVNLMLNQIVGIIKDKVPPDSWSRMVLKPGAKWLFEGTDDIRKVIQPIQFPNLIKDIYLSIEENKRAIQEVTGAVSATAGVGGDVDQYGGGTFRGQLFNQQQASLRWMHYSRLIESSGLVDVIKKIYQRIYQYKSFDSIARILGEERMKTFRFIAPEKLEDVATLIPLGTTTMETKGVKLAQMAEYAKLFMGKEWFKEYDFARKMWIQQGETDPDSVIFSPEEMKMFNDVKKQIFTQFGGGAGPLPQPPNQVEPPMNGPIAGNTPPPMQGQPRPAMPANGPGVSPIDMSGRPLS